MKNRYLRQTTLAEVGKKGQQKLFDTKVLVVGCGGLGNYVAVNLAASGIGTLHLVDFDTVDISNLHRQVFFKTEDVGKQKAETLAKYISTINDDISVSFSNKKFTKTDIRNTIKEYDYIVECTDSLDTKYLINDACVLEKKPLVYGSLHKFEAHIASFSFQDKNGKRTASLRDVFPEMPTENIPTCSEVGTLNPIVGIAGFMQANEVLKLVLKIGEPLINQLLIYNSLDNSQLKMKLKINEQLDFQKIWDSTIYGGEQICNLIDLNEMDAQEFIERTKNKTVKVISVLEDETEVFEADFHFPFSCFVAEDIKLPKAEYVIVCNVGNTSIACMFMLQKQYPNYSFKSLKGGVFSLLK